MRPPTTILRTSTLRSASASSTRRPAPTQASQHGSNGRPRTSTNASSTVLASHTPREPSIAANGSSEKSSTGSSSGKSKPLPAAGFDATYPAPTAHV